ncbi:MAG: hypothetical protein KAV82_05920 [Phycisphaerae bacterium]|nr:hypothetical protein [Phycisphaerae bacterium]
MPSIICGMLAGSVLTSQVKAEADSEGETQSSSFNLQTVYLELEGDYNHTTVRQSSRQPHGLLKGWNNKRHTQTNRDYTFKERIGFTLDGTILDPSFITFDGDISFALTQSCHEERGWYSDKDDHDTGHLFQYDMRVNFFTGKLLSGSIYALRQDDRISRRFQPTLDETRTGFGTSWDFAHEKFPMTLSYDYLETDRTGNWDERDDEHYTESTLNWGVEWIISDHHWFKFSYEHSESKQEFQGLQEAFDTTRDLFTLEHELEFGGSHQHTFRTLAHWQEESGDFARDFFEIGPQLTLRHSDNLETFYKYQFNRERYEGLDIETQRFDFQLVHRIYENLVTTANLFALYEDVEDDVDTTQYGGSVDWQYNRKNPYGRFYANLALAYDTQDMKGDSGVRVVLNESATFRDPLNITLRNRNVIIQSIVLTDTTNRRYYMAGRDYLVFKRGNVIQLVRLLSGRIADGGTVLIDYQYRTPTKGQIDTIRVDAGLEQRFDNGITPYYRFSYRNQEADSSTGFARFADRTDHHRLGVKYDHKRFALGAEYEIFDDTVEPYDAFHLDGVVYILQTPEHSLNASTRLSRFFFEGGMDDRNVTIIDVELDHRWCLREDLSIFERLGYRWEDDSTDGITRAWDVAAGVDYVMGNLTAELTFEYDRLDLPESVEDDFGLYFRIRRDFPNVLARRY